MSVIPRPVQDLLDRLEGVKRSGHGWMAFCPAHPNTNTPALSVGIGKRGDAIVKCFSVGCSAEAIAAAVGLQLRDLFAGDRTPGYTPPPPRPRVEREAQERKEAEPLGKLVRTYDYTDADGVLVHQTCRFKPKAFRQRVPCERPSSCGYKTGSGNPCKGWHWTLNGIEPVLYRLPRLLKAIAADTRIYIVEGEKDADALNDLGLVATTCPMGAKKWRVSYTTTLAGAHVVYLPDNDEAGQGHAALIANRLVGRSASVRILDLPGLPGKGDVTDWLEAGGTVEALEELVASRSRLVKPAVRWPIAQRWQAAP